MSPSVIFFFTNGNGKFVFISSVLFTEDGDRQAKELESWYTTTHEVIYLVYNLLRDVNITVASTQYEHERQKSSRLGRENNNVFQKIERPWKNSKSGSA